MSTITAILEPEADGTLRLPLPPELQHGKIKIHAVLELAETPVPEETASEKNQPTVICPKPGAWKDLPASDGPQPGSLKGFWMSPDFDEPLEEFNESME